MLVSLAILICVYLLSVETKYAHHKYRLYVQTSPPVLPFQGDVWTDSADAVTVTSKLKAWNYSVSIWTKSCLHDLSVFCGLFLTSNLTSSQTLLIYFPSRFMHLPIFSSGLDSMRVDFNQLRAQSYQNNPGLTKGLGLDSISIVSNSIVEYCCNNPGYRWTFVEYRSNVAWLYEMSIWSYDQMVKSSDHLFISDSIVISS